MEDDNEALTKISEALADIQERIYEFYELVVDADATVSQLVEATGLSRGTVQNIRKGLPVRIPPHPLTRLQLVANWPGTYGEALSDSVHAQLESRPF